MSRRNIHTQLVRGQPLAGDAYNATSTPIYQTATFEQEHADRFGAFDYSRSGNPTRGAVEEQLAELEHGARGLAFASGLAALNTAVGVLKAGDTLLAHDDLYGGSHRLFSRIAEHRGIRVIYADLADAEAVRRRVTHGVNMVHIETPTNPLLSIVNVREVAAAAKKVGAITVVDSSAMSPYLQRPLELGADIVLHSATKLLNGHADVSAGALVVADTVTADRLAFIQNAEGSALGPFDSFLLARGLKTLAVRLDRQQASAARVANFLAQRSEVLRVRYPSLETHPGREVHRSQASGGGVVISFETGDRELSKRVVEALSLFSITVSFGSIASTVSLPGYMSHASIPAAVRRQRAFPDDIVRLSVGLECVEELIADLSRAFSAARHFDSQVETLPLPQRTAADALV